MAFVDKVDFHNIIDDNILDDITETDDTEIMTTVSFAISFISGYLSARYDVVQIFNKTGVDRDPVILHFTKDITCYYLHGLTSGKKIPENRTKRFDDAVDWLNKVQAGEINPPDLPVPLNSNKDYVLFGSNLKRSNHI
jgi:phage gp36-like protein